MNCNEKYMLQAIKLSIISIKKGGGPFGAVIVKENKIIAQGTNTVVIDNDPTAHAEVNAIRNAAKTLGSYLLSDCIIYTSCEPCPMCMAAIYWARIKKIYYANTKKDAEKIGFIDQHIYHNITLPLNKRTIPCIQLLPHKALEAFKIWEKIENKKMY